jgi:hypothetical protein
MKATFVIPLLLVPLLIACDPAATVTIPLSVEASGLPHGSSASEAKAKSFIAGVALKRGYSKAWVPEGLGSPLVLYTKEQARADVSIALRKSGTGQGLEIKIVDFPSFSRSEESRSLEAEVRRALP